jgi:hypothetical protein
MITEWEKYSEFVDDTKTKFIKLNEKSYRFITEDGFEDICDKEQMLGWGIKVFTYIK